MYSSYKGFESELSGRIQKYLLDETNTNLFHVQALIRTSLIHARNTPDCWETTIIGWSFRKETVIRFVRQIKESNQNFLVKLKGVPRKDILGGKLWRTRKPGFKIRIRGINSPTLPLLLCDFGIPIFRFSSLEVQSDFGLMIQQSISSSTHGLQECSCIQHIQIDELQISVSGYESSSKDWLNKYLRENPEQLLKVLRHSNDPWLDKQLFELWKTNPNPRHVVTKFDFLTNKIRMITTRPYREVIVRRIYPKLVESDALQPIFDKTEFGQKSVMGTSSFRHPQLEWQTIKDVRIQDSAVVTSDSELFVIDESADPTEDFVSGQWESVFSAPQNPQQALVLPRPNSGIDVDEGILISGRNDSNWYHWVIEYLPKIVYLDSFFDPDVPLLISTSVPKSGVELLKELTNREIIQIPRKKSSNIKTLHVMSSPIQVFDSTRRVWSESLIFNYQLLSELRSRLVGELSVTPTRKIFLVRESGHRGLVNEIPISELAKEFDFEVVNPSKLGFRDQIKLFQSAKIVIGAGGAVMANYLFMNPGSRIICLVSRAAEGFVLPAAIASVSGAKFENVFGDSIAPKKSFGSHIEYIHADFKISVKKMKMLLQMIDSTES